MINKIGKITIYVEDQEQAKSFWIEKLGFILKLEQPMGPNATWIEVSPNEDEFTTLILYSKSLMEKQQPSKVAHPSVLFSTADIEAAYEDMKQKGIKVDELLKMPYGNMFVFYDQDENEYMLREDK
ncbi:VOC family protein [Niallia circulans]|jgi:lactoylglutathione lyase|uniref:VOC family protein n=1 Tax=Niallia circulans TaxID=1397 RepID=UPI0026EAEE6F|nr:VOC family protein [Niallia circulans]